MSGEGHPPGCPGCVPCQECRDRPAWCVDETPINHPCPHFHPICGDCWPGTCIPCRLQAEREMHTTNVYNPHHDPFYNPAATAASDAYWANGPREDPHSAGTFHWPNKQEEKPA